MRQKSSLLQETRKHNVLYDFVNILISQIRLCEFFVFVFPHHCLVLGLSWHLQQQHGWNPAWKQVKGGLIFYLYIKTALRDVFLCFLFILTDNNTGAKISLLPSNNNIDVQNTCENEPMFSKWKKVLFFFVGKMQYYSYESTFLTKKNKNIVLSLEKCEKVNEALTCFCSNLMWKVVCAGIFFFILLAINLTMSMRPRSLASLTQPVFVLWMTLTPSTW